MATETIVAVFDDAALAATAAERLRSAGVPESAIEQHSSERGYTNDAALADTGRKPGFWAWLTGGEADETHHALYDRSIESGNTVVTVVTDDTNAEQVINILEQHSPIDLAERRDQYGVGGGYPAETADLVQPETEPRLSSSTAYIDPEEPAAAPASTPSTYADLPEKGRVGEEVLGLAEEQLEVGKRQVQSGVTRVRRYVVERPVEEQITLRNEHISVFRRPVTGTAAVGADAFTDRTIEMTETKEEAVVSKRAQVVEEVVINKAVDERVETVRDTVRRDEVEIEGPGRPAGAPLESIRDR